MTDMETTRRRLIAARTACGADTPAGHRYSNMVEQLENYARAGTAEQRAHLRKSISQQARYLDGLK